MTGPKKDHPPIRLNKTAIDGLAVENSDYFNPVEGFKGLNIRVLPSGEKSFVLRYRFHGIQKKRVLGEFPTMSPDAAKKAHNTEWGLINAGKDPNQSRIEARKAAKEALKAATTVKDLVDRYLAEHTPGNSESWQAESKRLMNKHIIPGLGKHALGEVGPAEISAFLFKMAKTTPTQANRTRAVLRTMFGRAEEWGLRPLGSNPVAVLKVRTPETKRTRRLSDLELKALGASLGASKEAPELILAIRLALLAGMRKGEIQNLRWKWVDLEAGEIHLPCVKTDDNDWVHKTAKKTGKKRVVHLCTALVNDLKAITHTLGCPYVVPGRPRKDKDGKLEWGPFIGLQGPWERMRVAAKLALKGDPQEEDPGWHDLRRTFGSVATDLGLKGFVGELLGHAEATVTDIYTRSASEKLHEVAETIGTRIHGILTGVIDPVKEAEARKKIQTTKAKTAG